MAPNIAPPYFPQFKADLFHCNDEKQWKTQPDTIPVKTPVTPVTFSSSHYLIQHV